MISSTEYGFDRFLRYDELVEWCELVATEHTGLVEVSTYGSSHEGRDLLLVTITDSSTGAADTKPAHWVDASIHSTELTATVAACSLIRRLVSGYADGDPEIRRALASTYLLVWCPVLTPMVPNGSLPISRKFRRSSTRPWPLGDTRRWPGLDCFDIDGDGRGVADACARPGRERGCRTPTTPG